MSELTPINTNFNQNNNMCFLESETDPDIKFVLLDKEPLTLGRSLHTKIINQRLSKKQMKFVADYSNNRVVVEQVGSNKSGVNGQSMIKGEKRILYHGDKVSLLHNSNYSYCLNFETTPKFGIESNKRSTNILEQYNPPKKPRPELCAKWETKDGTLLVYNSLNLIHKSKVAAFDMDGTIITTQSGKVFPVDYKDWKISSPEVTKTIRQLSDDDYKIVIFTNQGGIGNKKVNEKTFKEKVENIVDVIKTPIQVFVATDSDIYRKPAPGMWTTFVSDYNGDFQIDMQTSFFCGDAAGRPEHITANGRQMKKDHSCCDRLFAMNIGLKFYTPEEYFWKECPEEFKLPIFNPNDVMYNITFTDSTSKLFSTRKEMIIMVGSPGSGKSYFASNQLGCHGHMKIINRDTLGSWQKCVAMAKDYLIKRNEGVVIDNTNPDIESRKRFIDVAKDLKVPCRIFLMNVSKEHARHNNKFRGLTDKKHHKIADSIINIYFSKYQTPSVSEGVEEIVNINFVPHFKNSQQESLYKMYLL